MVVSLSRSARNITSRGCGHQVLAAVDQQRGAGHRRRFDEEAHGARRCRPASTSGRAASADAPCRSSAVAHRSPETSVMPGATPHHAHFRRQRLRQHRRGGLQRRLRQRVRQVVGIQVAQFLVEQVHDAAASPSRRVRCACSACASSDRRRGVGAPVRLHRLRAEASRRRRIRTVEALLTTASSRPKRATTAGTSAAHGAVVGQVGG